MDVNPGMGGQQARHVRLADDGYMEEIDRQMASSISLTDTSFGKAHDNTRQLILVYIACMALDGSLKPYGKPSPKILFSKDSERFPTRARSFKSGLGYLKSRNNLDFGN